MLYNENKLSLQNLSATPTNLESQFFRRSLEGPPRHILGTRFVLAQSNDRRGHSKYNSRAWPVSGIKKVCHTNDAGAKSPYIRAMIDSEKGWTDVCRSGQIIRLFIHVSIEGMKYL